MSVRIENGTVRLEGACPVEDAEALVAALEGVPNAAVDLSHALGLHGAVVQALLVFAPPLRGEPAEPFIKQYLAPAIGLRKLG